MTVFEEACMLSCEFWVDSFPADIPEHDFSKKHIRKMNTLFDKMRNGKYHKLTRNAIKIILVAAVILSIATTVFAIPTCREFILKKSATHSTYDVLHDRHISKIKGLKMGYVPDGFNMTKEFESENIYSYYFENASYNFLVRKLAIDSTVNFDTEKYGSTEKTINGVNYVVYKADENITGIIFNDGEYIYIIDGNIAEDKLWRIALNIE